MNDLIEKLAKAKIDRENLLYTMMKNQKKN